MGWCVVVVKEAAICFGDPTHVIPMAIPGVLLADKVFGHEVL